MRRTVLKTGDCNENRICYTERMERRRRWGKIMAIAAVIDRRLKKALADITNPSRLLHKCARDSSAAVA
jgi:hypothetical protein